MLMIMILLVMMTMMLVVNMTMVLVRVVVTGEEGSKVITALITATSTPIHTTSNPPPFTHSLSFHILPNKVKVGFLCKKMSSTGHLQ